MKLAVPLLLRMNKITNIHALLLLTFDNVNF